MTAKFHANAQELKELAYTELVGRQIVKKKLAENREGITHTMYKEMHNPDFNKSKNRATGILSTYRSQEMQKISTYKGKH